MPEENERRKIQRLKKECEKLRDKLAETTRKLKDQEKLCSTVDEKERRYSVFLNSPSQKSNTHSLSSTSQTHTKTSSYISYPHTLSTTHTKKMPRSFERVVVGVGGYRDEDQQSETYTSVD